MDVQLIGGNFNYNILSPLKFITHVYVWMLKYPHFVSFISFTFLYSHNQHAFVTFVKLLKSL